MLEDVESEIPKPCPFEPCDFEDKADSADTRRVITSEWSCDFSLATSDGRSFGRECLLRENHDDVGILDILGIGAVIDPLRDMPIGSFAFGSSAGGRPAERASWALREAIAADVARQRSSYVQR